MMADAFPYPYAITVSDGQTMRTLQAPALGRHRSAIEAALADLLLEPAKPAPVPASAPVPAKHAATMTQSEIAQAEGYLGESCQNCGGWRMKRAGHCAVCDDCGETTGCS